MERILVCTAWPYANGAIHLGHVAGSLLPPDIFAKFHRLKGNDVLMVSGSDQHGTPVTVRAEREGVSPQEVADRYHEINSRAIKDLGITYDLFTKTHTENHFEVVHDVFLRLLEKGHLYKRKMLQYYCPTCERFLPDRYVEGTCPECGYDKARGDQCDRCGMTFEAGSLESAGCTNCGTRPLLRETEHYFFRLSSFQRPLLEWIEDKHHWKQNVQTFTRKWLEAGLEDRAITRDMTWGVPVPLDGWENKVIYVWFEAVIGYLSASKEWAKGKGNPSGWEAFWKDDKAKHYYFLGKDNIPFHTIIWPAILMGYGGLVLPHDVPANEFLTFKGEQFSKSRGVGIDIPSLLERFDRDVIRYYVSVNMPENRDSEFSWEDFETKVNNELVATLGNYYHRVLSFTYRHFQEVPPFRGEEGERERVLAEIAAAGRQYDEALSQCQFKRALRSVMDLAQYGNRYFDTVAPWSLIKEDRDRCGWVLNLNLEIVKALAVLSYPFLPRSAVEIWRLMGYQGNILAEGWRSLEERVPEHQALEEPRPLFSKVSIEREDSMFPDFKKLDLRVGEIKAVREHPNADTLLVLDVDIGKEVQLVAGLRGHYETDELEGKKIVVVANLKPARLRGVVSEGMLLAAEEGEKVLLLTPAGEAFPGDRVNSGISPSGKELDFQEFQKLKLVVGAPLSGGRVDVGREVELRVPGGVEVPRRVVVYLPSSDASVALALCTENGIPITCDGDISPGASVR